MKAAAEAERTEQTSEAQIADVETTEAARAEAVRAAVRRAAATTKYVRSDTVAISTQHRPNLRRSHVHVGCTPRLVRASPAKRTLSKVDRAPRGVRC